MREHFIVIRRAGGASYLLDKVWHPSWHNKALVSSPADMPASLWKGPLSSLKWYSASLKDFWTLSTDKQNTLTVLLHIIEALRYWYCVVVIPRSSDVIFCKKTMGLWWSVSVKSMNSTNHTRSKCHQCTGSGWWHEGVPPTMDASTAGR